MAIAKNAELATGRVLMDLCRWLAYFGGVVLAVISAITVLSIIGRALIPLGLGPITGDFEMVEMGCAIAVFTFLPWCQMKRGHVTVDVFIGVLPLRIQAVLGMIGDLLIALAATVILWRMWLGFGEKFPYGGETTRQLLGMGSPPFFPETTYELELPVWIPYGLSLIGAFVFFVVCVYAVWRSLNWTLDGQEQYP